MEDRVFCVNRPMKSEEVGELTDKRYCTRSRLFLRFVSASMCKSAYVKLMNHRRLYYKSMKEKMVEVLNAPVGCLFFITDVSFKALFDNVGPTLSRL